MPVPIPTIKRFLLPLLLFFPLLLCAGLSRHAGPSKCPRNAYTAVVFVVTNYIAHAFTVVRFPGDTNNDILVGQAYALCAPYIGYLYALAKMLTLFDSGADSKLAKACSAGAIVYLERDEKTWWPRAGDVVYGRVTNNKVGTDQVEGHSVGECHIEIKPLQSEKTMHTPIKKSQYNQIYNIVDDGNEFHIPKGYAVRKCPNNVLRERHDTTPPENQPPARITDVDDGTYPTYTVPIQDDLLVVESILALVQLIFAITSTSLSARETVDEYGYAAYSLTVLPFAAMSISNGIANATSRNYPFLYFAKTLEVSEARKRHSEEGEEFGGFVGRVPQIEPQEDSYWASGMRKMGVARIHFEAFEPEGVRDHEIKVRITNPSPNNAQDSLEGHVAATRPANQPPREGNLTIAIEPHRTFEHQEDSTLLSYTFAFVLAAILYSTPLAIAAGLSRGFKAENSTPFQRWAVGIWFLLQGAGAGLIQLLLKWLGVHNIEQSSRERDKAILWILRGALGGAGVMLYVVVGMEMAKIGVCGA